MIVIIKMFDDIEKMCIVGCLVVEVLEMIGEYIKFGVIIEELDCICYDYIVNEQKVIFVLLNYKGFFKLICILINYVVCYGIFNEKLLKEGDIFNVDIIVIKDGYYGDISKMFLVGKILEWVDCFCQIIQECMYKGIFVVCLGVYLGDIGEIIQKYVEKNGFLVVCEYCGYGIGKVFYEELQVFYYGCVGIGIELKEGMIFIIELMINQGCLEICLFGDGWIVIIKDCKLFV